MAPSKKAPPSFTGFTPEGLGFLKKLKKNNDREWFQPRKAIFEEQLQSPLHALLMEVEQALAKSGSPLRLPLKSPMFRIYRDIRFSANKTPYKTHVSGALYQNGKKGSPGGLYVHIEDPGAHLAAGFWQPERPFLTQWRLRMLERPKDFQQVLAKLKKTKLSIDTSGALKRMPRGFEAGAGGPLEEYFRLPSFVVGQAIPSASLASRDLPALIAKFAAHCAPLLDFGWSLPIAKPPVLLD